MKDYYKILEVNKEASPEIISKVYKTLAKKYHPDLQDDLKKPIFEEKFKEISEAYEILSDKEKRAEYDLLLENDLKSNFVNINDYESLKNYCINLENELEQIKHIYSSNVASNSNVNSSTANIDSKKIQQKAYYDAMNKAYQDAYANNLRNLGYKVRYKKTFKETCKSFLALCITAFVIYVLIKIIWSIPSLKEYIISTIFSI